jgi:hypothetical protein
VANTEGDRGLFSRYSAPRRLAMRLLSGWLVVALCLTFGCWQPLSANPANPTAIEQAASANSATHEAVYTYRRTKHGFERCYHRNRFGTRSWRSVFRRIPDC